MENFSNDLIKKFGLDKMKREQLITLEQLKQLRDLLKLYWLEYGKETHYGLEILIILQPIYAQIERREKEELKNVPT